MIVVNEVTGQRFELLEVDVSRGPEPLYEIKLLTSDPQNKKEQTMEEEIMDEEEMIDEILKLKQGFVDIVAVLDKQDKINKRNQETFELISKTFENVQEFNHMILKESK